MADVRSMLRAERANRRITHPHASYTSEGKLSCNLCEVLVKSEAHWQSHLHSTQHNLRSQREKDVASVRNGGAAASAGPKKRKADEIESSPQVDDRRKTRATEGPELGKPVRSEIEDVKSPEYESPVPVPAPVPAVNGNASLAVQTPVEDEEFAAFEREIEELERRNHPSKSNARTVRFALDSAATISAPAVTAEELAAQAREEESSQRGRGDFELEAEREDAARVLEEEFDEMESLEQRVRKLRERREALRQVSPSEGTAVEEATPAKAAEEVDEDDSDYEDDQWNFGGG